MPFLRAALFGPVAAASGLERAMDSLGAACACPGLRVDAGGSLHGSPVGEATDGRAAVTVLNPPRGDIQDRTAKIWPFKIHRAKQPYDAGNHILFPPVTGGKDGYWTSFDWDQAFRLGAKASNVSYSGKVGFARTEMYWPLTHMVAPREKALSCTDCHGEGGRLDWKALGYAGDPIKTGGRR